MTHDQIIEKYNPQPETGYNWFSFTCVLPGFGLEGKVCCHIQPAEPQIGINEYVDEWYIIMPPDYDGEKLYKRREWWKCKTELGQIVEEVRVAYVREQQNSADGS